MSYYDIDHQLDDYDDDRRRDAAMDDYDDTHPANMECEACGHEWHSPIIRATHLQPAEARFPDCPNCGS